MKLTISPEDMVKVGENLIINENWVEGLDGYYYYQGILPAKNEGETNNPETPPLFSEITGIIDKDGKFLEGKGPFEITVSQESIQIFAYDDNGQKHGFDSASDLYDQTEAEEVWELIGNTSN